MNTEIQPVTIQFTVSRSSLPSLLEWTERLQARFKVNIDIQWELDKIVQDTPQVRWVSICGKCVDCEVAKKYITTFCDPLHKMSVTYPDEIHSDLRESQLDLEATYSVVLQFTRVGQLLIKSQDEMYLMLVLSVIESSSSEFERNSILKSSVSSDVERRKMERLNQPLPGHAGHSDDSLLPEDNLDVDSESFETTDFSTKSSSTLSDPGDLLTGEPLRGDKALLTPRVVSLGVPSRHSESSISPDRKKIKGSLDFDSSPKSKPLEAPLTSSMQTLNSQQQLAVQRVLLQGDYTKVEIDRTLRKYGNNWSCSDLIEMLSEGRSDRNVPQTSSKCGVSSSSKHINELKQTQESLMESLMDIPPEPIQPSADTEFWPYVCSTPLLATHSSGKDWCSILDDETQSVIILSEGEDVMTIPSKSESVIVIGDSSEESDTPEVFYVNGVPEVKKKQPASKPRPSVAEKQRPDELHSIVESLRQQLTDLQDKLELEKREASSQQQAVKVLQQTQQEEIQRQQRQLLKQQQQFQERFQEQEDKLKAKQEEVLQGLQQQQQQQQRQQASGLPPNTPSEAIVIAPVNRNKDSLLRPIVIDGSNVAMCHGRSRVFSCRGIAICIQYFQKLGHQDITVFVPQGRRSQHPQNRERPIADQPILDQLKKQGLLSFTPSRRIGGAYVNCYDDRFIVELAVENDGVIVSNDTYRDLMGESPKWKFVIENRLVMFTFAGDRFMIPDDPLGRGGPRISQLLRKSQQSVQRVGPSGYGRDHNTHASRQLLPVVPLSGAGPRQWEVHSVAGGPLSQQDSAVVQPVPIRTTRHPAALAPVFSSNITEVKYDPKQSPFYKMLQSILPQNEEEIFKILTQFKDLKDANRLTTLVLDEIKNNESKQ